MHIVSVNYQFPSLSETFVLNQITGLLDRGHRVTPWCQVEGDWSRAHADVERYGLHSTTRTTPAKTTAGMWVRLAATHPLRALRLWKNRGRVTRRGAGELMRMALILGAIRGVDVYHCQFGGMGELVLWLRDHGLVAPVPVVTTFHGYDIREGLDGTATYPRLLAAEDPVIAISSYSLVHLQEIGFPASRLHRIPVAIDVTRFQGGEGPSPGRTPVQVLMVARLVAEKNPVLAIQVVASVVRDLGPDALRLVLVGDGVLRPEVDATIRECGIGEQVRLTGALDQAEVIRLYQESDVFLLTSDAENLPVSLMEAGAAGLPTVATRVGSIHEIVLDGETGLLSDAGDRRTLSSHLLRLVREPETRAALGLAAREHVREHFHLDSCLTDLEALFDFVAHGTESSA